MADLNKLNLPVKDETTGTISYQEFNLPAGSAQQVNSDWDATSGVAEILNKPTLGSAAAKDVPSTGNASTSQVVMGNDSRLTNSRPASDVSDWAKASTKPSYTASEVGAIATSAKGAASGVAELDSTGKVPSSQLPSYVDDVLEYNSTSAFPSTGEAGKIYVAKDTNKTYRWSGSAYVEISPSLALGETSSTAYRGDRGKTAYDHASAKGSAFSSGLYKITTNSEGHVTAATAVAKDDITGLGIPGSDTNTTYTFATGDSNGQIKVTPSGGSAQNVSVKGLGTAAYTNSNDYRKYYTAEFSGGGATDGYCLVCTLTIVAGYVNKPVEIVLNERGRNSVARLNILFSSVNNNDPTLVSFRVLALQNNYYIYKSAASTWQIYATKNEAWSGIKVIDYSIFDGGITITWNMSNASLPSGATQATHFYATENTWRGIQNNLTSDSTSDSLSAAQGKALKSLVDGKLAKPTVKTATLAASGTTVTFTGIPTSGNNMIDFFSSDGANYTAINTATSGQITLTYAATSAARTIYCRIEGV